MKRGNAGESGRDQAPYTIWSRVFCEALEVAFNRGLDLYGAENRLMKGFEYTAKYNLGF